MPKIVVTDTDFGNSEFERKMVEDAGIEFAAFNGPHDREPEMIIEHLRDADGAITSYGNYDASVFEALPNLKVVCKTGTGVDNIDVAAAHENGTVVCNVPGYGTEVVSDHAIALTLCVLRRIDEISSDTRDGIWDFRARRPLGQVHGRRFGVVGYGNIGRATARKANGLGFETVAWSHTATPGERSEDGIEFVTLDDLFRTCDVVSFHTALVPETHHLLNAKNIDSLKQDAIVINTSRGAVIDMDALACSLMDGKLWGAGLDVFETEPLPMDAKIRKAPHAVLTSHCAYWSEESALELRTRTTQNAIDVVTGHADKATSV